MSTWLSLNILMFEGLKLMVSKSLVSLAHLRLVQLTFIPIWFISEIQFIIAQGASMHKRIVNH
jgi:hypothetical protein